MTPRTGLTHRREAASGVMERIASDGVDAERLTITGDVDLRGLGRVDEPVHVVGT